MCFASPKPQLEMEMIVQFAFLQVSCDMFVLSFKLWSFGVCLFVFVVVVVVVYFVFKYFVFGSEKTFF